MLVEIHHITKYSYSKKVFLEPHTIRLIPKAHFFCHLLYSKINLMPEPFTLFKLLETDGSNCYSASFSELTNKLVIDHKSELEIEKYNPLNFIIYPLSFNKLPFDRKDLSLCGLSSYINSTEKSYIIKNIATEIYEKSNGNTFDFLSRLNTYINKNITYKKRIEGFPQKAAETLRYKEGSCRDLALLFMEIARLMNIPSRFVSGYLLHEEAKKYDPELHAWAEVYIPGGGWIGYDPTNGILCFGEHIPLVASFDPLSTLPVSGTYRGNAKSEIEYNIFCKIIKKSGNNSSEI